MTDAESQDTSPNNNTRDQQPPTRAGKAPQRRKKDKRTSPVKRSGVTIDRSAPLHQARVFAMQALFEDDLTEHGLDEILARMRGDDDEAIPDQVAAHAARLARGVQTGRAGIDPHIEKAAPAFPLPQLASIDRAVLRVAVYELLFEPEVPFKAVINEAVEIAKRFGGPNSGRFVNGVLRTISEGLPNIRREL